MILFLHLKKALALGSSSFRFMNLLSLVFIFFNRFGSVFIAPLYHLYKALCNNCFFLFSLTRARPPAPFFLDTRSIFDLYASKTSFLVLLLKTFVIISKPFVKLTSNPFLRYNFQRVKYLESNFIFILLFKKFFVLYIILVFSSLIFLSPINLRHRPNKFLNLPSISLSFWFL